MARKKEYKTEITIKKGNKRKQERAIVEQWFESGEDSDFNAAYPIIKTYITSYIGQNLKEMLKIDNDDIEDIFQNVMVKAMIEYKTKDLKNRLNVGTKVLFETWVTTVARNEAIYFAKKKHRYIIKNDALGDIDMDEYMDYKNQENNTDPDDIDYSLVNFDLNLKEIENKKENLALFLEENINKHKVLNKGVLYLYLKYFKGFKPKQRDEFFMENYKIDKTGMKKVKADANKYMFRIKNEIHADYLETIQ